MKNKLTLFLIALVTSSIVPCAVAQGTAFTYQGRLDDTGQCADGYYGFQFALYGAQTGGTARYGNATDTSDVLVSNGLFTVTLDFGPGVFNGATYWLQTSVRTNSLPAPPPYTVLSPRLQILPTPYSIYAETAGGVTNGSISAAQLNTLGPPGADQVLSWNGTSLVWTNVCALPCFSANAWLLTGNATTPGEFLGTTDDQALEVRVNNQRSFLLVPGGADSFGNGDSATVVAGWSGNTVDAGLNGAVIAGGGSADFRGAASSNRVSESYSSIGGGSGNWIQTGADHSVVGGGWNNLIAANAYEGVIGGGVQNSIQPLARWSVIGGGLANTNEGLIATIAGGDLNSAGANADYSFIGGGYANLVGSTNATISGGMSNVASGLSSTVGGGGSGPASYPIPVGNTGTLGPNLASGDFSFVGGGSANSAGQFGTVAGGLLNGAGPFSAIGGGNDNQAQGVSTIAGGQNNSANAKSTVGGGQFNDSQGYYGTIAGGDANNVTTNGQGGTIGGGVWNLVEGGWGTVSGGEYNHVAIGPFGTIGGGLQNTNFGSCATIGGGSNNVATGAFATVPGGGLNYAGGDYSFAAGENAAAGNNNTFVWSDGTSIFSSTANDQFLIRAGGGVGINTNDPSAPLHVVGSKTGDSSHAIVRIENFDTTINSGSALRVVAHGGPLQGALSVSTGWTNGTGTSPVLIAQFGNANAYVSALDNNGNWCGTSFNVCSDRNAKENFSAVDPAEVLDKVASLPISRWNYKADDGRKHIGPMAQDFHDAFNVGMDDKHIATVDEEGVALAAIQGLNERLNAQVKAQAAQMMEKDAAIHDLTARLERLEKLVADPADEH